MKNSDDKMASFYTLGEKEVCSEYRVDIIIVLAHKKKWSNNSKTHPNSRNCLILAL